MTSVSTERDKLLSVLYRRRQRRWYPLTATQEGIWLAERLDPGNSGYHNTAVLRITGPLDGGALYEAFTDVQRGNEALRCRVVDSNGEPWQAFDGEVIDWERSDLRGMAESPRRRSLQLLTTLDATRGFDLGAGPLWRVRLVRLSRTEHMLILVLHHLISDGWSHGVLLRNLLTCYMARARGGPPPGGPSASYADWLVEKVRRERGAESGERLDQVVAEVEAAPRRVRLPGLRESYEGKAAEVTPIPLSSQVRRDFARACRERHCSPYMAMAGLFSLLISQAGGVNEVVMAAPVAGRLSPESQHLIGCLVDLVPLRIRVRMGEGPAGAVDEGRRAVATALGRADIPYRSIGKSLATPEGGEDPITNVAIQEFNAPTKPETVGDLHVEPMPRAALQVRHDLALSVPRSADDPAELIYPVEGWAKESIVDLAGKFSKVVETASRMP